LISAIDDCGTVKPLRGVFGQVQHTFATAAINATGWGQRRTETDRRLACEQIPPCLVARYA
jgi:hypothetical protein